MMSILSGDFLDSLNEMNDKMLEQVHGVYVGVVTDNKDPEKLGRVKVKIPILDDQNAMDWARMTTLMAGKDRGTLFVPEVGDEVLVAFHMGDIREPIVIGSLWNTKDSPPPGKDDKNNIRKIKSRGGHEIIFDDKDMDGKITVQTKDGHKLELLDKIDTIKLQDNNGQNSLTIKGGTSGEIEIKSGATKIMINNKGDVAIESLKAIKLKSTQIAIEATATLDLKASAALNIKSDGIVTVKGTMVKIN
jgi:uncharacterized protein involved in type VI secretion and phage assembly